MVSRPSRPRTSNAAPGNPALLSSALGTASPASRLLKAAVSTASSPFTLPPPLSKVLGIADDDIVPYSKFTPDGHFLIPAPAPLSTPLKPSTSTLKSVNTLDAPIAALVPSTSVKGVDQSAAVNVSSSDSVIPSPSHVSPEPAAEKHESPSPAQDCVLAHLRAAELAFSKTFLTLDPLSQACTIALQNLATLRYHIAAAIAQQAALQNPKFTKDLIKATNILQRDHHRLAREQSAREKEARRIQRQQEADSRYKQRQYDAEIKYKRKVHLAELALKKQDRADKRTKRAAETRDYRENYTTKYMEPNPHNQPKKSAKAPSQSSELSPQHFASITTQNSALISHPPAHK